MTLIVGILCEDGVVVGADGAASMTSSMGQPTVMLPVKKLCFLHNSIILGVSGSVGLSQTISGSLSTLYDGKKLAGKKPHEAMQIIRQTIWAECLQQEFSIAAHAQTLIGQNMASQSALCWSIIAVTISKEHCLFGLDQQGHPFMATKDLPFSAIGSGQPRADPFLSFLMRIFWPNRKPKLSEGIFATYWTLNHAIKTSPGGVADPIQIGVLESKGTASVCRELDQNELRMQEEAVTNAEKHLKEFSLKSAEVGPAIPVPSTALK